MAPFSRGAGQIVVIIQQLYPTRKCDPTNLHVIILKLQLGSCHFPFLSQNAKWWSKLIQSRTLKKKTKITINCSTRLAMTVTVTAVTHPSLYFLLLSTKLDPWTKSSRASYPFRIWVCTFADYIPRTLRNTEAPVRAVDVVCPLPNLNRHSCMDKSCSESVICFSWGLDNSVSKYSSANSLI